MGCRSICHFRCLFGVCVRVLNRLSFPDPSTRRIPFLSILVSRSRVRVCRGHRPVCWLYGNTLDCYKTQDLHFSIVLLFENVFILLTSWRNVWRHIRWKENKQKFTQTEGNFRSVCCWTRLVEILLTIIKDCCLRQDVPEYPGRKSLAWHSWSGWSHWWENNMLLLLLLLLVEMKKG